jgi:hypothetical protein
LRFQQPVQVARFDGFDEMGVEAGVCGLPAVVVVAVRRNGDEHSACVGGLAAQMFGHSAAIETGHGQVTQHDIGSKRARLGERFLPVECGVRLVTPQAHQQRQDLCGILVVIHDKNAKSSRVGLHGCTLSIGVPKEIHHTSHGTVRE